MCYYREDNGLESLRQEALQEFDIEELKSNLNEDGSMSIQPEYFEHKSVHCNYNAKLAHLSYPLHGQRSRKRCLASSGRTIWMHHTTSTSRFYHQSYTEKDARK